MERIDLLQHALEGIEHKRRELASLARSIQEELYGDVPKNPGMPPKVTVRASEDAAKPKYKRSAATRKKMAAAQRARYRKSKKLALKVA